LLSLLSLLLLLWSAIYCSNSCLGSSRCCCRCCCCCCRFVHTSGLVRCLHNRFVLQQSHISRSSRTSRLKPAAVQQNQLYSSGRQRPLACGFTCLRNAPAPAYFKRAILRTPPPSTEVHGSVQRLLSYSFCCAHLRRPSFSFFE
jgi:hypothetical protein